MYQVCVGCGISYSVDHIKNKNKGQYCTKFCYRSNSINLIAQRGATRTKIRATRKGFDHNIDKEYLVSIFPKDRKCPIMGVKLVSLAGYGKGSQHKYSPELNRIDHNKGYIKGNVEYISSIANRMLANADDNELKQFNKYLNNKYKGN